MKCDVEICRIDTSSELKENGTLYYFYWSVQCFLYTIKGIDTLMYITKIYSERGNSSQQNKVERFPISSGFSIKILPNTKILLEI